MPTTRIEFLLSECRNRLNTLKDAGGATQTILDAITWRLDALDVEIKAQLATATDEQKTGWERQTNLLLEAIQQIANDGPTNSVSEMYKTFASNPRIYAIGLWAIVFTTATLVLILRETHNLEDCGMPEEIACALPLIALMGALGGFLTCIQSFGLYVGNRQFLRSWTIYYFLFPLKGAGLAIIVFFLIHTDLGQRELDYGTAVEVRTAQTNGVVLQGEIPPGSKDSPTNRFTAQIDLVSKVVPQKQSKQPNLVLAALVAALTGLFANQAIEMLGSVFSVIFKKVEGKDRYGGNQDVGPAPQKPPAR